MEKQRKKDGIFDWRISQGTKFQIPVDVHMLLHVYKQYKCLHDTIKLCSLPSLYLSYKVVFKKKKQGKPMKAKYLVQRTNCKGQILYYNAQK